ncbi:L-fucose:H+ symporter permease [Chryseolinea sp. T2]|uniref:L-fucose:H+ symporter permease n=1 Tax=Chryseolinea sp. T2 TaxID=3129255 RepID=UPI00307859BD
MRNNNTRFAVGLITSLFFLWGFALNLNSILIPHLKKACQLSDFESALIDAAFYFGYFVIAIPAGRFMERYGYKSGILLGLLLFALGAFLFFPAAESRTFGFFLGALFVIASGCTFLETAANPYITVLGDPVEATQRINFAQSFNGLAAMLAPLVGGWVILSGKNLTAADESAMSADELNAYLNFEASAVKLPYVLIGVVVLTVAYFFWKTKLPNISEESSAESAGSIWKEKNLILGVVAQFFYVGAQVCASSFFIRYSYYAAGVGEKTAANYLGIALGAFMAGRFIGTFLMTYVTAARLLAIYSAINIILLLAVISLKGMFSIYALIGVNFFMSIMFPTIFALSIRGLGAKTKQGSSLLIMSIVGGAVFPVIMGRVSDLFNIQFSYIVPGLCFFVIFYFAMKNSHVRGLELGKAH